MSDGRDYDFRDFWTAVLARLQVAPPTSSVPFGIAWQVARVMDSTWRLLRVASPPPLNRQMLRMIGLPFTVSIAQARHDLGFSPVIDRDEALEEFRPYRTLAA